MAGPKGSLTVSAGFHSTLVADGKIPPGPSPVDGDSTSVPVLPMPDDVPTLKAMLEAERIRNTELLAQVRTSVPMLLSFQTPIQAPPASKKALWRQACANDEITSDSWRDIWLDHVARNVKEFDADSRMIDQLYGAYAYKPTICCASGPSLKKNRAMLKKCPDDIGIISCLHNFGAFVDEELPCKYFVTLDAGDVTIPEMGEGGKKTLSYYQDASKDYTLIAGLVAHPDLIKIWKGPIYFFNVTIPDQKYMEEMPKITRNRWVYSVGGNTFGASMYHAAWIWGSNPLALIGADFAFDYMHKFHSWDSQYDKKFQGVIPCVDIFGNRVFSWPSYQNFRCWTEFQALGGGSGHNLEMINCTEGGTLGAYPDGNIVQIKQMALGQFIDSYTRWRKLKETLDKPVAERQYEWVSMW